MCFAFVITFGCTAKDREIDMRENKMERKTDERNKKKCTKYQATPSFILCYFSAVICVCARARSLFLSPSLFSTFLFIDSKQF